MIVRMERMSENVMDAAKSPDSRSMNLLARCWQTRVGGRYKCICTYSIERVEHTVLLSRTTTIDHVRALVVVLRNGVPADQRMSHARPQQCEIERIRRVIDHFTVVVSRGTETHALPADALPQLTIDGVVASVMSSGEE